MDSLSIVIPAYNEERRLPQTLRQVLDWLARGTFSFHEVIVVDDGSRDGTARVVEEFAATNAALRLARNPGNRGKGYAVRNGMLEAKGEWILYTDADLSTPIAEIEKLRRAAGEQDAGVAIGSRAVDRSLVEVHQPAMRELSGRAFNLVMRAVTGLPFRDTQCGFKLFRADAARQIFSRQKQEGFSFDVEDLLIAKRLGVRAVEVPVRWSNVEGTKVRLSQGVMSFLDLVKIRMDHR
ncbi:MAG TPA: dolichyl-phosphate beta-glucosyltransferase [Bryobacteraceae bacterium]|nr:dolichyl-phosphate beta-glucosyltransferase [Bryobacteraceae bacterium]